MTIANIDGIGGAASVSSWTGWTPLYGWIKAPVAQLAANGYRPVLVYALAPVLAGKYGTVTVAAWAQYNGGVGKASSPARAVGIAGTAVQQDWFYLAGNGFLLVNAIGQDQGFLIGFDISGNTLYGRNGSAGSTIFDGSGGGSVLHSNAALAGQYAYLSVPTAPQAPSVTQSGVTSVLLQWSAPASNGDNAISGYILQWSQDPTFATGVQSRTVGVSSSATIDNLTPGAQWFFRIAALNDVAIVAGTSSLFTATVNLVLIAETGNLDSWTPVGVLPAGVTAVTVEGLRRAVVPAITGAPNALLRENNATAAPRTLAADTYGAKRTVTGLTIGATYRLSARAAFTGTLDADSPNVYALGIVGDGYADPGVLAVPNVAVELPPYEFIATATSHDIAVRLAESVTRPTIGPMERLALFNITLAQIPTISPYRLQSILFESSLLNHFDLANNSVGARWWVDAQGVTQFSADLGEESPIATFTDVRQPGKLEYVNINTSYDTRNVVNDLTLNQHGMREDPDEPGNYLTDDYSENYKDITSGATWGSRAESMETSLYDDDAYTGSVQTRAAEVLGESATPELTYTSILWNAQEDPLLASKLDIYSRIDVEFRGVTQQSRIVNIKHTITPTRWMMTLQLIRKE